MARLMMDEHFYWGLLMWRYVVSPAKGFGPEKVFAMPPILLKLFMKLYATKLILGYSWIQGIARHSEEQVTQIISDDLRALSRILGNKKFLLGDEPCEDDCAIFGELAQALWCMPGSPYDKLVNGTITYNTFAAISSKLTLRSDYIGNVCFTEELVNLKQYCIRMKEQYWPDWENCVAT